MSTIVRPKSPLMDNNAVSVIEFDDDSDMGGLYIGKMDHHYGMSPNK